MMTVASYDLNISLILDRFVTFILNIKSTKHRWRSQPNASWLDMLMTVTQILIGFTIHSQLGMVRLIRDVCWANWKQTDSAKTLQTFYPKH